MNVYTNKFFGLFLCISITTANQAGFWDHWCTIKSMGSFHVSMWWNDWRYGSTKKYDVIIPSGKKIEVSLSKDSKGIISVTDNKKAPILLGRIPQYQSDIESIRKEKCVPNDETTKNGKIGVYTFNRDFERYWAGFDDLQKEHPENAWHRYDTTDFTSPSVIDLFRIVRDLKNRDTNGESVSYVHCKAGRGRSATGVAAYILYLAKEDKKLENVTVPMVETFIQTKRPQVKLGHDQYKNLNVFRFLLLQDDYSNEALNSLSSLKKRDEELQNAPCGSLTWQYKGYIAGAVAVGAAGAAAYWCKE